MATKVKLILEYDMGDYSDVEEEGGTISTNPKDYEESFYQGDIFTCDMNIIGVKIIKEGEEENNAVQSL